LHTTSLGTGQLIAAAITKGAREILLGIGGSATNDAGIGIAAALGWQFLDINGCEVAPIGQSLLDIRRIVCPQINVSSQIKVLCDVHNPLFGNNGAAHVYGKQKGASNADIATLDAGLRHIAKLIAELQLSAISPETPGAGAAGGVGFGAMVFLGAKLYSGIDYLLDLTGFDAALVKADLIVTGEGRLDGQTLQGKLIRGLCRRAAQKNIPVIALCGQVSASEKEIRELGLRAAYCINDADVSTAEALPHTAERLTAAAARLIY
jgi:glycerate kinase